MDNSGKSFGKFLLLWAGALVCVTSLILRNAKPVRKLEKEVTYVLQNNPQ